MEDKLGISKVIKRPTDVNYGGHKRVLHGREGRESIKFLKNLGKEVGELVKEREIKKNLEHRIKSLIVMVSLAFSIIFLSPNITGNAVADISLGTSNWIGGVLFILGISAAFLYFKGKQ